MLTIQPDLLRHESDFPAQFGRYTLQGILGEGGMARVFRAELQGAEGFRKPAAVKIVRAAIAADNDNLRKALINEARVGGLMHHPNVVETYDYGEVEGHPYIAMELVRGMVLDEVIERVRPPEPARTLEIAIQICAGLDHAHNLSATGQETNLVHRDLKPSNIIISQDGLVKVMDFGIAKASSLSSTLTQTGTTKGTPAYMSPEQVGGQKLDRRSDIFSLGAIISELALNKRLFDGDTLLSVLSAVIQVEERLDNSDVLADLDAYLPGLGTIVHRSLRMSPDLRYTDAAALESALQQLADGIAAPTPLKLWVRDLMAEAALENKTKPAGASWSSLDESEEPQLEATLQTDAPISAAAAAAAEVGKTRPQAASSLGGPPAPSAFAGQETRAQAGYQPPAATEALVQSREEVPSEARPTGTLWTQGETRRGLPTGLLLGLLGGLVISLAAVGAIVLTDRIWTVDEQEPGDPVVAEVVEAEVVKIDDTEHTTTKPPEPGADSAPKVATSTAIAPPPTATPKKPARTPPSTAPEKKAATPVIADAKGKASGLGKPKLATPAETPRKQNTRQLRSGIDREQGTRVESQPSRQTPVTTGTKVASNRQSAREEERRRRRSTKTELPGKRTVKEALRLIEPSWTPERGREDGSKRGYFSLKTESLKRFEAEIHLIYPDGSTKLVKMQRQGSAGGVETWGKRVTFPRSARGTIRWKVRMRAREPGGRTIKRTYNGNQLRF